MIPVVFIPERLGGLHSVNVLENEECDLLCHFEVALVLNRQTVQCILSMRFFSFGLFAAREEIY